MLELDLSTFDELRTERLCLRELREDDDESLFAMRSDDDVMQYIGSCRATRLEDAREVIKRVLTDRQNNDGITWGLTFHDDDSLIGSVGYYRLKKEHYRGEIGYMLGKRHWGRGLMSEAVIAAIEYGFHTIGFHSIEAITDPDNQRSIAVLLRNGFKQEGLFKENFYHDGKFYDSIRAYGV